MHGPAIVLDQDQCLNVLEQQKSLNNLYTQICICFPLPDASSHATIVDTLTSGLERLSASFPWVAGQIINESDDGGKSEVSRMKPLDKIPLLVVKDLRDDPSMPSMDAMRQAEFPMSMLDENIIAPRNTLPSSPEQYASEPNRVFLLQATFITGGLLLTLVGSHNAMDMTGQGEIIRLLSKACRNEDFTPEELTTGNIPRRDLIPLLDDSYNPGSELAYQLVTPAAPQPSTEGVDGKAGPPAEAKCTWAYFTFPPASLTALKALATQALSSGYVSTDDVLSSFIWQSITRARLPRLNPAETVTFARAVDVRRYLGISPRYTGLMQNMTYFNHPLRQLLDEPLGGVAARLRTAVDPKTSSLAHDTRALATYLNRVADKDSVSFTATLELSKDIMLSSWSKLDCYELDFGLGLGKPESVRRPLFVAVESLLYLMPKTRDGEIAVSICLRDEDLERLRTDEEFVKYAKYIG